MTTDARDERDRQRRLRATQGRRLTQPARSEAQQNEPSWIRVVLRSVDVEAGEMYFHRIRYATSPPEVGQYEAFGSLERGYPLETAIYEDYEVWAWPEMIPGEDGEVDNPVSTLTVPLLATRTRGYWVLMVPLKGDGSLLPADEPVNECNFG